MTVGSTMGEDGFAAIGDGAAQARERAWQDALPRNALPAFVIDRLDAAAKGKVPWMSSMTPAELRLAASHGIRPVAAVTATCWYQYGYSWTRGHAEGWRSALDRLRAEALACGANAVVDVRMRTVHSGVQASMDFTLVGTAVRIDDLPASVDPIVATVPALEFVRLLEMGFVPCGLAIGARYQWLTEVGGQSYDARASGYNKRLPELTAFWEAVRREAHRELRADAGRQGTGVLAHTQFGQLIKKEGDPASYLGRHIVIGTVVDTRPGDGVPHGIHTVVDMRDDLSPLMPGRERAGPYALNDTAGEI